MTGKAVTLRLRTRLPEHLREIDAPAAWQAGYRGNWERVAIVDSGIDYRELAARRHLNERPTSEDFAFNPVWDPEPSAYDYKRGELGGNFTLSSHRYSFIDEYGHGTKMACIVGARPGFDGVFGLVPRVLLYNYRVVERDGLVLPDALRKAVEHIVERETEERIRVALFALDQRVWKDSEVWSEEEIAAVTTDILRRLHEHKVLAVFAASDSPQGGLDLAGLPTHPASVGRDLGVDNLLVVAAHGGARGNGARLTETSNWGRSTVHLAAPGRGVLSASPMAPAPVYGTSGAAALVAGAAALISGEQPDWTPRQVRDRLLGLCRRVAGLEDKIEEGRVLHLGGLAAQRALRNVSAPSPPAPESRVPRARGAGARRRGGG